MPSFAARRAIAAVALSALVALSSACRSEPPAEPVHADPAPPVAVASAAPKAPAEPTSQKLSLGAPIAPGLGKNASLTDVAKAPESFAGTKIVTEGKVTAVCQHKGCWMELKDDKGEAHVKMAGHAFFVPRTASGKRARVLGRLAGVPEGASCGEGHEGHGGGGGCKAEAEKQLGRPLAKLELVADGVEILD
ncbi:MAG: DUF4920 domain-containing protein [Myxococcales bacterium]|jgi:hypothetical protein|nr:DUF4920 domain-containing protein [Myxococcales bacterium]